MFRQQAPTPVLPEPASTPNAADLYTRTQEFEIWEMTTNQFLKIAEHPASGASRLQLSEVQLYSLGITFGLNHEFLIMRLDNPSQSAGAIFLRLDRRREEQSIFKFASASSTSNSNDKVVLSLHKGRLLSKTCISLNELTFKRPPSLSEFCDILAVVCVVMDKYDLTRENCWVFSSVIQDFLQRHFEGTFYVGSLKHEKRSKETRERVANAMTSLKHRVSTSDSSQSSRNASVVSQYEEVKQSPSPPLIASGHPYAQSLEEARLRMVSVERMITENPTHSYLYILDLTSSTIMFSQMLFQVGAVQASLQYLKSLIDRIRPLAEGAEPASSQMQALRSALTVTGFQMKGLLQFENALPILKEAIELFRAAPESDDRPLAQFQMRLELAALYSNYAVSLYHTGRKEAETDGISSICEAITLRRQLLSAPVAGVEKSVLICHLGASLSVYGMLLARFGKRDEALAKLREALALVDGYQPANDLERTEISSWKTMYTTIESSP